MDSSSVNPHGWWFSKKRPESANPFHTDAIAIFGKGLYLWMKFKKIQNKTKLLYAGGAVASVCKRSWAPFGFSLTDLCVFVS